MERDQLGEPLGFQRAGIGDEVDALDDRKPKRHGTAEGMEQRQAAEDRGAVREVETGAELADVREDIAVAQDDAFGLAGRSGGEKQRGLVFAAAMVQAQHEAEHRRGQELAKDCPPDDFRFERGQHALDENQVAVRWPGKRGNPADKGVCGNEAIHIGLPDAGFDRLVTRGEIEVDRDFPGEQHGEVCDQSALAGRQHDGDARLVSLLLDEFRQHDGRGEDLVEGESRIVRTVEDAFLRAVFFEALE